MNSIVEKIKENADAFPQKEAVIAEDGILSYQSLWIKANSLAEYLRKSGISQGDCVLVQSSHTTSFIISIFAIHLAGAIFVPLDKQASVSAINNAVSFTDARMYISKADQRVNCNRLNPDSFDYKLNYQQLNKTDLPRKEQSADLIFTTGTTGEPKAVELSHGALIAGIENIICGNWVEDNIRYLLYGPYNHTFSIRRSYAALYSGNTLVLLNGLTDIVKFFNFICRHKINATHMHPPAVRILLKLAKNELAKYAEQFLFIETGTAPYPGRDKEEMCRLFPKTRLSFGYGSSESDAVVRYNYNLYNKPSTCVGKPTINSEIFLVDHDGKVIKSSKETWGRIVSKGPMNMKGYWRQPDLTKDILRNGMVYNNDLGYFDEEGFLHVLGRFDDVINIGGIKVSAKEIEDLTLEIPGVEECACISIADEISGHVPKLFVVMDDDAVFSPKHIYSFLEQRLERYKLPKIIEKINELPKTYNGKIQKINLK